MHKGNVDMEKQAGFYSFRHLDDAMKFIRSERESQKISQRAMSEFAGITQVHLSRLETGTGLPSLDTLFGLAEGVGYDVSITFTRKPKGSKT